MDRITKYVIQASKLMYRKFTWIANKLNKQNKLSTQRQSILEYSSKGEDFFFVKKDKSIFS